MRHILLAAAALTLPVSFPVSVAAQEAPEDALSPNAIVDQAPDSEWVAIGPDDLVVMTLAPDAAGKAREVIIQLMPAPFSQGWVENIRTLARAQWYDGISVNRVQDNYVVQWGDPGHDNPESGEVETKALPDGLNVMGEEDYVTSINTLGLTIFEQISGFSLATATEEQISAVADEINALGIRANKERSASAIGSDTYTFRALHHLGWPLAQGGDSLESNLWPVHCYGMVGVGRNYSPDTGSGAELYTVIGHAPRHLDRNIALVGRIISGMEHLSSMTRGSGALGFYTEDEAHLRTPIQSIRVASDLAESEQPRFEYLSTEGETFAAYAEARANRRDPFFITPAGGADICNIPVPVRPIPASATDGAEEG